MTTPKPRPTIAYGEAHSYPVLPLRDIVVFPHNIVPLFVGREKSIRALEEVMKNDALVLLATQKNASDDDPAPEAIYETGTLASVLQLLKLPDGTVKVLVEGLERARVQKYSPRTEYYEASAIALADTDAKSVEAEALARSVVSDFESYVKLNKKISAEVVGVVQAITDFAKLGDAVASHLAVKIADRQAILETLSVPQRLEKVLGLMESEISVLQVEKRIRSRVKRQMEKTQREYYLNEQLKAIQKELGEGDGRTAELEELRRRLEEAHLPPEAQKAAERELDRLRLIPPESAEHTVVRTYLEWLAALPWAVSTEDNLDLHHARAVLDEDHFDLEKIKDRILEYLAVRRLKQDPKSPILCFVGPPGVGKTSLGRSIARAMGRKFVRLSLGGIRDEAEIRGHRRTYIGSLPGRIIQNLRNAGSNNPLFMLDEIDKLGMDFRGDPASALLEVLDPEQNNSFQDHYLDVPFDLSRVMFVTTANVLDPIPAPLRDRMEVIELAGYTEHEKLEIARRHLIPKQLRENGLEPANLRFEDDAIVHIIRAYTREAGLRNLEREIGRVCRKVARAITEGRTEPVVCTVAKVGEFLGPERFFSEVAERTDEPGVAVGLAWTPNGGDILFIESTRMAGKKTLTLTGHLGDVMKESAQAALSWIRSRADRLGLAPDFFENMDIHVHVPAGAIPKDGPSAGVTIATSLASLLTGRPVRPNVAMTGEITLRGKVLPVGGIKEKVLAARRAGIDTVILPQRNAKDLEDVPADIRAAMHFVYVDTMDQVLEHALAPAPGEVAARAARA